MFSFDVGIPRSPAGFPVHPTSDNLLVCEGTGHTYPVIDGNAHLYDEQDVPALLAQEAALCDDYVVTSLVPDLNIAQERIYAEAKEVNTRFLFDALRYETPKARRVVELGAWRCESIVKFANLGFQSYAVDFFPGMVNAAARLHAGSPFHRLSAPMSVLPFRDKTIDLLFMHANLHHALPRHANDFHWCDVGNLHDALCEIRRVLKRDGALMLLGEGVYPEGLPIEDRYHERKARAGETFRESWYTTSEYESAFRRAGVFPNLMSIRVPCNWNCMATRMENEWTLSRAAISYF